MLFITKLLPVLLLTAAAVTSAPTDVPDLKPCDVSLFADSFVVVLGQFGVAWADGNQSSLEALNDLLDERFRKEENQVLPFFMFRWETAKLFYTANYSFVLAAGIDVGKERLFTVGVLDTRSLHKTEHNGFRKWDDGLVSDSETFIDKNCWMTAKRRGMTPISEGDFDETTLPFDSYPKICDGRTLAFIPSEERFVFDGHKSLDLEILDEHPTYKSREMKLPKVCKKTKEHSRYRMLYNDTWWSPSKRCEGNMPPAGVPHEMVADFHNVVDNEFGRLHDERGKEVHSRSKSFLYNQLESGNFKLQVETFAENGTEFYYHVFTRLGSPFATGDEERTSSSTPEGQDVQSDPLNELYRCYIRRVKKEEPTDKYDWESHPVEYPRMLLIPKESGPRGVAVSPSAAISSSPAHLSRVRRRRPSIPMFAVVTRSSLTTIKVTTTLSITAHAAQTTLTSSEPTTSTTELSSSLRSTRSSSGISSTTIAAICCAVAIGVAGSFLACVLLLLCYKKRTEEIESVAVVQAVEEEGSRSPSLPSMKFGAYHTTKKPRDWKLRERAREQEAARKAEVSRKKERSLMRYYARKFAREARARAREEELNRKRFASTAL